MTLEKIFDLFKNVAKGPNSTIAGVMLGGLGGYMIYHTEGNLSYLSAEAGLFLLGIFLFLSGDSILGLKSKKKEKCDCDDELCEK